MQGAFIVLVVVACQLILTLTMLRFKDKNCRYRNEPVTWFYFSWMLGLLLCTLPIFKYPESFGLFSGVYIPAFLASYSAGVVMHAYVIDFKMPKRFAKVEARFPGDLFTLALLVLGVGGTLLLCVNSYLSGGLSLADRMDDGSAQMIRDQYLTVQENKLGPLGSLANPAASLGVIGLSFVAYRWRIQGKAFRPKILLLLGAAYIFVQLVFALLFVSARFYAIYMVLIVGLSYFAAKPQIEPTRKEKLQRRKWYALAYMVGAVLFGAAAWHMSTKYVNNRAGETSPERLISKTHRAVFDDATYQFIWDSPELKYALFTLSYASTPIPTLVYYLDLPTSQVPGPFYGEYNFPPIARAVRRFTVNSDPFAWDNDRAEIYAPLAARGNGTNVWPTMLRDLIADFGYVGSLLFAFVLGFYTQNAYRRSRVQGDSYSVALTCLLKILGLFSGLISVLFMPHVHWALYSAAGLSWWNNRKKR